VNGEKIFIRHTVLAENKNKCCFTKRLSDFDCLLHEVDSQLFESMQNSQHLYQLFTA